jgi:putative FmdB family regulatory protein
MPLYEYTCRDCGTFAELLVGFNEQPACPDCGGKQLEKQLSVIASPGHRSSDLPVCETPRGGGCGLPQCGTSCQFE